MADVIFSGITLEQHKSIIRDIVREEIGQGIANLSSSQKSENALLHSNEKKFINSIKGLATFLQCSPVTAQKLKNEGLIPFMQIGRKILFDPDLVLESMGKKNKVK
jgi:2,4-dienoyl-CoA reductase-like NADH-dependent reductase (Old Yellow Enzyme family)